MDQLTGSNNTQATAYNLGTLGSFYRTDSTGTGTSDPVDYFSFTVPTNVYKIRVSMSVQPPSSIPQYQFLENLTGPGTVDHSSEYTQTSGEALGTEGTGPIYTVYNVNPGTFTLAVYAIDLTNSIKQQIDYGLRVDIESMGGGNYTPPVVNPNPPVVNPTPPVISPNPPVDTPAPNVDIGAAFGGGVGNLWQFTPTSINYNGAIAGSMGVAGGDVGVISKNGIISQYSFPGAISTKILSINDKGDFAGVYSGTDNIKHLFVNLGGVYSDIVNTASSSKYAYTYHVEINNVGQVAGDYTGPDGFQTAFLYGSGGVDTFRFGGSNTWTTTINDSGSYAGYTNYTGPYLAYSSSNTSGRTLASSYFGVNTPGYVSTGTSPSAVYKYDSNGTIVDNNNSGTSVGSYFSNGHYHGFTSDLSGKSTPFDVPNSQDTVPTAMNNFGQIVGYYTDTAGSYHAFVKTGSVYSSINLPGDVSYTYQPLSPISFTPRPLDINDAGQILIKPDIGASYVVSAPSNIQESTINFAFSFKSATVEDGANAVIYGPNQTISVVPEYKIFSFADGSINTKDGSPLINDLFYFSKNLDVWTAHIDADQHYNQNGWHEGRNPNAFFSTNGYLAANQDVAHAGINPLNHYDTNGWKEGRDPSAGFDNELYLLHNPDVKAAGIDPLAHYLANGQFEGRQTYAAIGNATSFTHGSFDAEYYLLANADVAKAALAAGGDTFAFAFQHYQSNGWKEGRAADAYFDSAYYLAHNPDIAAAGINPLQHYDQFGWKEGRDPSAGFHTNAYLAANPDVAAAHIDPLTHYLQYGADEGRHLS